MRDLAIFSIRAPKSAPRMPQDRDCTRCPRKILKLNRIIAPMKVPLQVVHLFVAIPSALAAPHGVICRLMVYFLQSRAIRRGDVLLRSIFGVFKLERLSFASPIY